MPKVIVKVPVNNHYYDYRPFNNDYSNELSVQNILKKINSSEFSKLYIGNDNFGTLTHVNLLSFRNSQFDEQKKLVYDVIKSGNDYYIKTGLYVGYLFIDGYKLEINSGYNNVFLKRMLNVSNNIYFDNSAIHRGNDGNFDSFLNLILEYLFLTSFKKCYALGLPSLYKKKKECGLNLKGKIDFKKFVSRNVYTPGKISYVYDVKDFDQDIIDIIYLAFNSIKKASINKIINNGEKYLKELKTLYSGHIISKSKLNNAFNNKSLLNPMFSKFKLVLKYAKFILEHKNIVIDDDKSIKGVYGFILDISELWEIYLTNLLTNKFNEFKISSQVRLNIYENTFFARTNYPDIVMESNDKIAIIDAKFKTLNFKNGDIDRNDLHQIHSYSGYYNIDKKDRLRLSCLVYPSNISCDANNNISNLYGLKNADSKFCIEYIKIGNTFSEIIEQEECFLNRLSKLLNV